MDILNVGGTDFNWKSPINEEENEDFCEEEYFNFKELSVGEEKHFGKFFAVDGVSFTKLKIDLRNIFVKASYRLKILKIAVFARFSKQKSSIET